MPATTDPLSHIPLHPLSFEVLMVVMEEQLHGYGIAKAIEEKDNRLGRIYPTNLYRRLRDMVRDGLISEAQTDGDEGARRSTFQITPLGHQVAIEEARRLEGALADARRYKLLAQRSGDQ